MPFLILILENCPRQEYHFGTAPLTIGKAEDVHIQLPSKHVASHQATIFFEDSHFVLQNEGASVSSFVNGKPVSQVVLQHYDILRFGEYLFLFHLDGDVDASPKVSLPPPQKSTPSWENKLGGGLSQSKWSRAIIIRWIFILLLVFGFFLTVFLTAAAVLYYLPLAAREIVLKSKGFEKIPIQFFFRNVVARERMSASYVEEVVVKYDNPIRTTIKAPRSLRLIGRLHFLKKTTAKVRLKIQISQENQTPNPTNILDESVDVESNTEWCTLFSMPLASGSYNFEGKCEEAPADFTAPATLLFYIEEQSP